MATIGEFIRWCGIALAAIREGLTRHYRVLRARLLKRDVVVAGSERRFRALLESAPDAIILADWHGHIRLINAQTERVFGYDRRELTVQSISRLVPERMRDAGRAHFREYVRGLGGSGATSSCSDCAGMAASFQLRSVSVRWRPTGVC